MAGRSKADSMMMRENILDAAEICYRELGVSATTLNHIAEKACCTRGAIYWHFPEPSDVLFSVIERGQAPVWNHLQKLAASTSDTVSALKSCVYRIFDDLENNIRVRAVAEIVLWRCDFSGMQRKLWSGEWFRFCEVENIILNILFRAQQNGEIHDYVDCKSVASLIVFSLTGAVMILLDSSSAENFSLDAFYNIFALIGREKN
jgi:TetR/AcrR family transcriptional regulator, acrAB operon repressor